MIELETALQRILAAIPVAETERVPLESCAGRIVRETLSSTVDLPAFDNSAMDGFAVRAGDVSAATSENPVSLRLCGKIAAGGAYAGVIKPGECARLFTGSPLPAGADAVVMQEDTRIESGPSDRVLILDAAKPFENVRLRGSDVKRGSKLVDAGQPLSTGAVALLAATGVSEVSVGQGAVTGLLATGSELLEAGQELAPGQIYESNRIVLASLVKQAGAMPRVFPLVADTLDETRRALGAAFKECDMVVTSGGVSVGEFDFVKAAFEAIGGQLEFWKVSIRPGKPFVFGRLGGKFLFGLPGNPVSAFVTFLLLVRPALLRRQGAANVALPSFPGVLAEAFSNPGDRRHFMRVRVDAAGRVFSAGLQTSHALASLAAANGMVNVPPQTQLPAGTTVQVMRWD